MESKFENKTGNLTFYAFKCGYIQRKEGTKKWKEIYMEHNTFHVRAGLLNSKYDIWECFDAKELTLARNLYRSIKTNNHEKQ